MLKKKELPFGHFSNRHAFSASASLSLLLNLVMILGILFGQTRGTIDREVEWFAYVKFFLWHLVCNLFLYYLLFRFNFKIIRSRYKAERLPWSATIGTILICLLVSPILSQLQWWAIGMEKGVVEDNFVFFNLVKDFTLGIIVILVTRNMYANLKREQTIIQNQRLIEENIRTRFDALKNQLDPHFLFNSLNTLNGLIGQDDDKAHEYVDNLSSVFRYTLQNKHILPLDEEIAFVESYTTLLKIRYGENLDVQYEVAGKYRNYAILPVSLQLLVENAVKHNVISNKCPLQIRIATTEQDSIVVSNRVNPKRTDSDGSGVGLANLAERYFILFRKTIGITETDGVFSVEIPLMKETDKKIGL